MAHDVSAGLRPVAGPADLAAILAAVGHWNRLPGSCGLLHPGDISHHLSNGLRGADPAPYLHLYEEAGRLVAVVMLYAPRHEGFELLLDPARRGGPLEAGLLAWATARTWAGMQAAGVPGDTVGSDATDGDPIRRDLLLGLGYAADGDPYQIYTTRPLGGPLPEPVLPPGFTIRPARGIAEAAALGAVHSSAFGSKWPGDAYAAVMRSPAYGAGQEMVCEAPDGRLAAFLIVWLDPVSRSGLFEPVGTHRDFQRRGLGRALMSAGLRLMQDAGMERAVVIHNTSNAAAAALYAAMGFTPACRIQAFRKSMREDGGV